MPGSSVILGYTAKRWQQYLPRWRALIILASFETGKSGCAGTISGYSVTCWILVIGYSRWRHCGLWRWNADNGFTFGNQNFFLLCLMVITHHFCWYISLDRVDCRCSGFKWFCRRGNGRLLANLCDVRSLGFDTADYQCTVPFRHDPYCALIVARSTALGVFSADDAEGGGGINDVDRLLVSWTNDIWQSARNYPSLSPA